MNYLIRAYRTDEPVPYDLLMLGDENRALIDTYLPVSQVYVLELDEQIVGAGVLRVSGPAGEVMNIAIAPEHQGKGLGRALLRGLIDVAEQQQVRGLLIATGNSGIGQLALYQQEGFDLIDIDRDYFLRHYAQPIWENKIQCKHQLILKKTLAAGSPRLAVTLRRATHRDLNAITQLFYDTVTTVNAAHYTPDQVAAWRSGSQNTQGWLDRIDNQCFLVAVADEQVAGFASISLSGYVDLLFVHQAYQRVGIARQLMDALEEAARALYLPVIFSDVSLTARPFFEKRGFRVVVEQEVEIRGVRLTNTRMTKSLAT